MVEKINTWTEHYLKFILEDSNRGFLILNKKLRITYINRGLISKLGYSRDYVVKKRISDFLKDPNKFKRNLLASLGSYTKKSLKCKFVCKNDIIIKLPFNVKIRVNKKNLLRGYYFIQDHLKNIMNK